jgi:hypothetical protein
MLRHPLAGNCFESENLERQELHLLRASGVGARELGGIVLDVSER